MCPMKALMEMTCTGFISIAQDYKVKAKKLQQQKLIQICLMPVTYPCVHETQVVVWKMYHIFFPSFNNLPLLQEKDMYCIIYL